MNHSSTSSNNKQTVNDDFVGTPVNPSENGPSGKASGSTEIPERSEWLKDPKNVKRLVKSISASSNSSCTANLSEDDKAYFTKSKEEFWEGLRPGSWKDLERGKKFKHDEKIALITEDTLVVGVDVASNKFDLRAYDKNGTELTVKALQFPITRDGFDRCRNALSELAVLYEKRQIIVGCEPTGHYWFTLYFNFIQHGITVVMVNPYAVNRTKEVADNLQSKSDSKDPHVIAELVRDGNYSVPYLPEGDFADAREFAFQFDMANEDHMRWVNRLHRWYDIYWPEMKAAVEGNITSHACMTILSEGLTPKVINNLGAENLQKILEDKNVRASKKWAERICIAAADSIGLDTATEAPIAEAKYLVNHIRSSAEERSQFEEKLTEYGLKIYPNLEAVAEISGITLKTSARFVADLGDLSRFSSPEEIVKISGLCPVFNQSGKYKGMTKISKRGRKRLRATLYIMADGVVKYDGEFKEILEYYMTRPDNRLKRKEALMVICNKLIRVIVHMLRTGEDYNPDKLREQIKRQKAADEAKAKSAEDSTKEAARASEKADDSTKSTKGSGSRRSTKKSQKKAEAHTTTTEA